MSDAAAIAEPASARPAARPGFLRGCYTFITGMCSFYFVIACCSLYWLVGAGAWLFSKILPRSIVERAPFAFLLASTVLMSAATQTIPNFFPNYAYPGEIAAELAMWFSIGIFARCYLIYIAYPETFEGLKQAIASRPFDRWISTHLHHPIDAIYTRIWVGNSVAMIPLTLLLILPQTNNYFVLAAYGTALLLLQFPHELADHVNIHTRIFQPKIGASEPIKKLFGALQFYFEYVLAMLVARAPNYYRVQHVYVHHVEDNGLLDSQTTAHLDRTSFLDFSRHAFKQGLDLVFGVSIYRYIKAKGKNRQLRDLVRGMAIWWAFVIIVGIFNPVGAIILFVSRFIGGNMQSLVAFWQHGLVDPKDIQDNYGNTTNYAGPEHGNLGNDYHVEHHVRPGRHWAAYYEDFSKESAKETGHRSVVMHKETFSPLTFVAALWGKDYAAIASYGNLGGIPKGDKAALARVVEERTRPVGHYIERLGAAARFDLMFSRAMAFLLPTRFQV